AFVTAACCSGVRSLQWPRTARTAAVPSGMDAEGRGASTPGRGPNASANSCSADATERSPLGPTSRTACFQVGSIGGNVPVGPGDAEVPGDAGPTAAPEGEAVAGVARDVAALAVAADGVAAPAAGE